MSARLNDPKHLEQRLRSEHRVSEVSPGFTESVMRRVENEDLAPNDLPSHAPFMRRLVMVVAGSVAAATLFIALRERPETPVTVVATAAPTKVSVPNLPKLPALSPDQIALLTARVNEPLERELQLVISDTRQAIQFVASNFMPEDQ